MTPRFFVRVICAIVFLVTANTTLGNVTKEGFYSLFDGTSLKGWHTSPGGEWKVKDGTILGISSKKESRHGLLISNKTYTNFTLKLKFRVIRGNSGFYFRSEILDHAFGIFGIQVGVDNLEYVGGFYKTVDRKWVKKTREELVANIHKPSEWNEMTIQAIGPQVIITLNGTRTIQVNDSFGGHKGHLILRLQGDMETEVQFKDIQIREEKPLCKVTNKGSTTDSEGFKLLFNGKGLKGWQTTGNWLINQDGNVTLHPRPGEKGWARYGDYLTTTQQYGDFILDLEFKINKHGNSGVFLRVGDPLDQVDTGFEVQIIDTHGKQNPTDHDCGGIVHTVAPLLNMAKPAGEWNHYTITCRGNCVQVVFNGKEIINLDLSKSAMKNRPARGFIAFQDEGKPTSYRRVRIKELH